MLSGDRSEPAAVAAHGVGIDDWQAAIDPKQKVAQLETLAALGRRTLMVGDGLNDTAALAVAHVSMSPGSAASASQAAADMILQGEDLAPIVDAVDVARAARRRVVENFAFAAVYNAMAVPLAAVGGVTPLIAAIAMSASSVVVMLNALRLKG
jgi:Cu2+-exporting ATPase